MTGSREHGVVLQARDRHLLSELGTMRLIDLEQARRVCSFGSYNRTHDRLSRLVAAGLLRRFYLATEAGGRKAVYGLSENGAEVGGVPFRPIKRKANQLLSGDVFAAHQLAINDVYLSLEYCAAPLNARLICWRSFREPLSKSALLTPDGYFELESNGEVRTMFVEVDLSSESHKVWQKKISAYIKLAVSGEFARLFSRPQFRVLVIADSERRMENLRRLVSKSTDKIFWFSTLSRIMTSGIHASVWLRPTDSQPRPLV